MRLFRMFIYCILISIVAEAGKQQSSISYLNTLRRSAGLTALHSNMVLQKAAKSHAHYLLKQQQYGHYEKRGYKGYTGRTPSDRVLYAGYPSRAVMENVSVNAKDFFRSIDTLFAAIYHRFVFLGFDRDEIGMGYAFFKRKRKIVSAYVYLLGSRKIAGLCTSFFPLENGTFYMNKLCKDPAKMVPQDLYEAEQDAVRRKNASIVVYPYPAAKEIPPAFFTEHPHPLPGSKVSGYPVSVQFNPAFYHIVKLKKFRLYDTEMKRIKRVKILDSKHDVNHRLSPLQFALMPLDRLAYGKTYNVEFEAFADGKHIKKRWQFTTKHFKEQLYTITKKKSILEVKKGEKIILFFKPGSNKDVLKCVNYTDKLQITCYDQNTLQVSIPENCNVSEYMLKAGGRNVMLKIK